MAEGVKPLTMRVDDEGALGVIISVDPGSGHINIDFGKPIHWISMTKAEAFEFARHIMRVAADTVIVAGRNPDARKDN